MTEGKVSVSDSKQYYAITELLSEYEKVNVNKWMLGNNKVCCKLALFVTTAAKPTFSPTSHACEFN